MEKYSKSAIFFLVALSLAGCSKAEEFQYNPDSALQIESVSGISPFALMQEPASKAVISGETLPSEEAGKGIGLFVTASDGSAYDGKTEGYSNIRYTYNGTKWSATSPIYLSNTTGKLYGYFPYNVDAANLTAIPVVSSLNGTDYLYATEQEVSFTKKTVSLTMNHALARLHLTIKKGDKYLSDCSLTKIVLQSKAIDASGTMDITTGAITATKAANATGTFTLTGTDAVTKTGIEKDILLVPADNTVGSKDITLTLTIDGVDAEVKFTGDKGLDIRSGIQCNATLTIEDTGIKVTGVGVGVWGDGGSRAVQVQGHTVTVKVADDIAAGDIMFSPYIDGNNVIIKASSFQSKWLVCNVGDKAQCERAITNDKFTFTISEISSNIDAILDYAPPVTIKVLCDSNGKVWIGDDQSKTSGQFEVGQQVVIHVAPNDNFRLFKWDDNNRETSRTINVGEKDLTYSASFISSDLIPGLFTVNSSRKQVFFSRGNLYWNNLEYCFEDNQYTVHTKSSAEPKNHIAHFYWSKSADVARSLSSYSDTGKPSDIFFANNPESFEVSGHTGWSVLTGNSDGEWKYLIERKDSEGNALYKLGVKVCGSADCLVLLPDDWKWGENGVGDDWQNGGYPETPTEGKVMWKTMEAAGAVCLPLAGYRGEYYLHNPDDILLVDTEGRYWSSTPNGEYSAHCLDLNEYNVSLEIEQGRQYGCCVRLVTEYQSEPSAE